MNKYEFDLLCSIGKLIEFLKPTKWKIVGLFSIFFAQFIVLPSGLGLFGIWSFLVFPSYILTLISVWARYISLILISILNIISIYILSCIFNSLDKRIRKKIKIPSVLIFTLIIILVGFSWSNYISDPNIRAKGVLNVALTDLESVMVTGGPNAVFYWGRELSAQTITSNSEIGPSQVCMGINAVEDDFELIGNANSTEGYTIKYTKGSVKKVEIIVLCAFDSESIAEIIENEGLGLLIDASNCKDYCDGKGKCCAVMLQR